MANKLISITPADIDALRALVRDWDSSFGPAMRDAIDAAKRILASAERECATFEVAMDAEADVISDEVIWLAVYNEHCGSNTLEVGAVEFPDTKSGDKFTVTVRRNT
jgi:hypothetical protein